MLFRSLEGYCFPVTIHDESHITIATLSMNTTQNYINKCVHYTKERETFGTTIDTYQTISFKIARMETRAHATRTTYYDAATLILSGKPFKKTAAVAKLIANKTAMDNTHNATQIFNEYGYMNEYLVAQHYRDNKILEINKDTTEVQLMLIAREADL